MTSVTGASNLEALVLGIDLGTTSIKVSLLGEESRNVIESFLFESRARVHDLEVNSAEQDVAKILSVLQHALEHLSSALLSRVTKIGICGQMHGCVMWKENSCSDLDRCTSDNFSTIANNASNLITWEDRRCTPEFLRSLPQSKQRTALSTGFGCATLFWLQRNNPSRLECYDYAGTIMDFIVCILCQSDKPCMSSQSAASWGYFNVDNMTWELEILKSASFPSHLLPVVVEPGVVAGKLQTPFFGIPVGTPVTVALGDYQCSVLSSTSQLSDAVLNVGTASQMAVVIPSDDGNQSGNTSAQGTRSDALQVFPYFQGMEVITATSLSGGNIFATFVDTLLTWMKELGIQNNLPSTDAIYGKLLDSADRKGSTTLKVNPKLWGERHTPEERGRVSNLTCSNISLGDVTLALGQGFVENFEKMMSREFLRSHGIQRIVGCGSALVKNKVLQKQVEQVFGLPLVINDSSDASVGAALAAVM